MLINGEVLHPFEWGPARRTGSGGGGGPRDPPPPGLPPSGSHLLMLGRKLHGLGAGAEVRRS